jgi:hypothetical protein
MGLPPEAGVISTVLRRYHCQENMNLYLQRTSCWAAILVIVGLMALAMPESLSPIEDASDPPETACCLLDAARGLRSSRPTTQKQAGRVKAEFLRIENLPHLASIPLLPSKAGQHLLLSLSVRRV